MLDSCESTDTQTGAYGGMFGNLGNLAAFVKSAQEMQKRVADVQEVLKAAKVEGSAGGDLVRVTANGKGDIERISIDPSLLKPEEKEALEELCSAAVNQAVARARELAQAEMARLMGGLDLPPGLLDPSLLNGRP